MRLYYPVWFRVGRLRKRNPVEIDGSEDGLAAEKPENVKETADEPPSEHPLSGRAKSSDDG
jgi:hypothetical protein